MKTKLQSDLQHISKDWEGCEDCALSVRRINQVWGREVGTYQPGGIIFVGEAPGKNEDKQGLAFVGRAGRKLDCLLAEVEIEHAYIVNTVACWPPSNRVPRANELASCLGRLERQVKVLAPRVMVTLGRTSTLWMSGGDPDDDYNKTRFGPFAGQTFWLSFAGIRCWMVSTYHPAFLLRRKDFRPRVVDHLRLAKRLWRSE